METNKEHLLKEGQRIKIQYHPNQYGKSQIEGFGTIVGIANEFPLGCNYIVKPDKDILEQISYCYPYSHVILHQSMFTIHNETPPKNRRNIFIEKIDDENALIMEMDLLGNIINEWEIRLLITEIPRHMFIPNSSYYNCPITKSDEEWFKTIWCRVRKPETHRYWVKFKSNYVDGPEYICVVKAEELWKKDITFRFKLNQEGNVTFDDMHFLRKISRDDFMKLKNLENEIESCTYDVVKAKSKILKFVEDKKYFRTNG